jgi:pyruvate/2-oxoglutarate dehydrogenase complex dihydrolipoamide acyltransferase (E2) component
VDFNVTIPELGVAGDDVIIGKWLKALGDPVTRGEPLVELVTDKATVELESSQSGILVQILAPEGTRVPFRSVVAILSIQSKAESSGSAGGSKE